jgi:hypothetical protein
VRFGAADSSAQVKGRDGGRGWSSERLNKLVSAAQGTALVWTLESWLVWFGAGEQGEGDDDGEPFLVLGGSLAVPVPLHRLTQLMALAHSLVRAAVVSRVVRVFTKAIVEWWPL